MTGFGFERLTVIQLNQPLAPTTLTPPSTTTITTAANTANTTTTTASNTTTQAANATNTTTTATTAANATNTTTTTTATTTTIAANATNTTTTTAAPSGRKKRGAYLDQSLDVVAVVQFSGNGSGLTMAQYAKFWADLSLNQTSLTTMDLDPNFDSVSGMGHF